MDNKENEQNIVDSNNLENSIETTNTNMENTVLTTPQDNNTPQVVEVNNTKEVTKNVTNKEVIVEKNSKKKKEKKGHPIFLILLLIFLFAFVYFLPDITKFITDYQNDKNGVNELKSGTMTCTFNNSTNNSKISALSSEFSTIKSIASLFSRYIFLHKSTISLSVSPIIFLSTILL